LKRYSVTFPRSLTRRKSAKDAGIKADARTADFRKAGERNGTMRIVRGEKELKRKLFIRALKDLVKKLKKLLRKN
jgi:hypothetical protein